MPARRWSPGAFPLSELDRLVLGVSAPDPNLPPLWVHPEPLLERAATLDVFPLVFHRLRHCPRGLPDQVISRWEERFRANAARNLYLDNEQRELLAALAAAGVAAVPLKGLRLAELAYGDLALRTQVDIDLYVSPRRLPAAFEVLTARGYRPLGSRVPPRRLAATGDLYTSGSGLGSNRAGMPVQVELHWRILPVDSEKLESILPTNPQQFPSELAFLYLCVHASADRWGTLKSLVDLAHLAARQPPGWEEVLAAAERLGLARILYITLGVLLAYFDLPVLEPLLARLDRVAPRGLPRAALANPFAPPTVLTPAATH
ncbi:nucleotidyltransferase family protein, partial [Acidobacteriia bacterium AH_259_A11_L15]|nr:nucleotidyltransferase family protein [Acidobacteriia bacterium AH_259_A11_L15]